MADIPRAGAERANRGGCDGVAEATMQMHELLNFIASSAPPGIGFELGLHWQPDDYAPYGNVLRCCANLREVSSVLKHFQKSLRQPHFFADSVSGDDWVLEFATSAPFGPGEVIVIDELLSRTRYEIEQYTGESLKFKKIELAFKAPSHKNMYDDLFQCPVTFNRPRTIVRLSRENLHRPVDKSALPGKSNPDNAVKGIFSGVDVQERVALAILETLVFHPGNYPSMQQVADMFGTSISTLKRMLNRANVSYRPLVDIVRQEYVKEYLALTALAPKEIAYRAGFTNVNNFRRAFDRWMAMTPNEFRKALVQPSKRLN